MQKKSSPVISHESERMNFYYYQTRDNYVSRNCIRDAYVDLVEDVCTRHLNVLVNYSDPHCRRIFNAKHERSSPNYLRN